MEAKEIALILLTKEEEQERLDTVLAKHFKNVYSRAYFQYLIEEGLVLLNGIPLKKRAKLRAGSEIEVKFISKPKIHLAPEAIPLAILYEDEYVLAINKPAGMVVHPAPGNWSGTFVNGLLYHCDQLAYQEGSFRPGIVHRLDKGTSGVLVAAKTFEMQQKLATLFASRQVYKEYWTVCLGRPPDGEVDAPIGRHPIHRKQMAMIPNGKEARSFFKTLGYNGKLSIVQVLIATGRTHQIRVHLKSQGTPILGDDLYGSSSLNHQHGADRPLLHAATLKFQHPITGSPLQLIAEPPDDMVRFIRKILSLEQQKEVFRQKS